MIDKISNILITMIISLMVYFGVDYYKSYRSDDLILVFDAKKILMQKERKIKDAILQSRDPSHEESEMLFTIKKIDQLLVLVSKSNNNKPIFQKSAVLTGPTKDVTPQIEKYLKEAGL